MNSMSHLIHLISDLSNVPGKNICPTTSLKNDLNLDSMDTMLLIVKLEHWFNVVFSEEEVERVETVKDLHLVLNSTSTKIQHV